MRFITAIVFITLSIAAIYSQEFGRRINFIKTANANSDTQQLNTNEYSSVRKRQLEKLQSFQVKNSQQKNIVNYNVQRPSSIYTPLNTSFSTIERSLSAPYFAPRLSSQQSKAYVPQTFRGSTFFNPQSNQFSHLAPLLINCSKLSSSCLTSQSLLPSLTSPQPFHLPFRIGRNLTVGGTSTFGQIGGHANPTIKNKNEKKKKGERPSSLMLVNGIRLIEGNQSYDSAERDGGGGRSEEEGETYFPYKSATLGPEYLPPKSTTPSVDENDHQISKTTTSVSRTGKTIQADNDLKHPPHIHSLDVKCSKATMTINIEFNRAFYGIIYSKGFYKNPECIYVNQNSGLMRYSFKVNLGSCGTKFINEFESAAGQAYLENVLVLQNEPNIQEIWDTIQRVQCIWERNINKTLTTNFTVDMLKQEIVNFNGDTATAKLDIQIGKGPFAPAADGFVRIGETMTLVVSVKGDADFDLQVRDCLARDETSTNMLKLTDEKGCNLNPKLIEPFQKTNNTGNTGASIIAYAFFHAFKFPDVMDLFIECNVELCKPNCEPCPEKNELVHVKTSPSKPLSDNTTANLEIKIGDDPFGTLANEPVRVDTILSLVISVKVDPGFDMEVRDCFARDKDSTKRVDITNKKGCIVSTYPKFHAFQKTNNTRNTGASIIAYASFLAFKLPFTDVVFIKCNVEICETSCEPCPNPHQSINNATSKIKTVVRLAVD